MTLPQYKAQGKKRPYDTSHSGKYQRANYVYPPESQPDNYLFTPQQQ